MTTQRAIEVLESNNHWRRCNDVECGCEMENPKELGVAIDFAISKLKEL